MTGHRLALHALPMFHGMGVTAVPWAVCSANPNG